MNAEKGFIENLEIGIQEGTCKSSEGKISADDGYITWVWSVWKLAEEEDGSRVKFSLKVGLAVLLVSILVLIRAPYDMFGTNIVWSILTVAVMFEYTVGATFNRGFNRAIGSLLAGILAVGVGQLALWAGRNVEPILIALSIFLIGTQKKNSFSKYIKQLKGNERNIPKNGLLRCVAGVITSFMKLWPSLAPYEHGLRVVLFTYCLIVVSGYRMGNPIQTAMERLYSIAIGGFVAALVNVLVFPIWAGELLHMEIVDGLNAVADSLEECVNKYLEDEKIDHAEFIKVVTDEFPDELAYKKCKATLSSSAKLQCLANSAQWEPPHDRFKNCFYPWSEYVKVGAVLRYCAYGVMALHGVLHSEIQAPHSLRITFRSEIQETTSQATELIRSLANDINNMKISVKDSLSKSIHSSTERLRTAINIHWYILLAQPFDNSSEPASQQSNESQRTETSKPQIDIETTYRETMKKQLRTRIFESETTAVLSVTSFITLLLEFLARLDHLVDAVDDLSRSAKFKQEATQE